MDRATLEARVIEAAKAWAEAKQAWEATSRVLDRPENLSELKGNVRRAERELLNRLRDLEEAASEPSAHSRSSSR